MKKNFIDTAKNLFNDCLNFLNDPKVQFEVKRRHGHEA